MGYNNETWSVIGDSNKKKSKKSYKKRSYKKKKLPYIRVSSNGQKCLINRYQIEAIFYKGNTMYFLIKGKKYSKQFSNQDALNNFKKTL